MTGWPARDYEPTSSVTASHAAKVVVPASCVSEVSRAHAESWPGRSGCGATTTVLRHPAAPAGTLIAGHDVDWEQAMAAAEPVGLEYTIMAVTCFFSPLGGAVRRRSGTRA